MKLNFKQPSLLKEVPILRLLLPFLAGVVISVKIFFPLIITFYLFILAFFFLIFTELFNNKLKWKLRYIPGLLVSVLFFLSGLINVSIRTEKDANDHYHKFQSQEFIIVIDDALAEKEKTYKTFARVQSLDFDGKWITSQGKLLLYFQKSKEAEKLKYGDKLLLKCKLSEIASPLNPGEFDYRQYLGYKQIYAQSYLKSNQWQYISAGNGNWLIAQSLQLRAKIISMLQSQIKGEQECAVAVALLVGDDDAIDSSLMQAYSSSGTLHVLSVSGMHVGVIYLLLAAVLGFLKKNKILKHLYFPLIIILVWYYSMLTGFSSSVLRSAMMLTLVVFGKWINSKSPVLNTLAVSLFLLLCYNPFMITEVGFQLSYLAVFGIVSVHPKILPLFKSKIGLIQKAWELTSVSISAQITTSAISLFYFHQFPNLFIVSNLIVIPLTTIAIYLSVLVPVVAGIPYLNYWVAFADAQIISFVNRFVKWIDQIPGAVTSGISITITECILLNLFLIFSGYYLIQKRFSQLAIALSLAVVISSLQILESMEQRNQNLLTEYKIPKHSAYGLIKGHQHILYADSSFIADKAMQKRYLQNFWDEKGIVEKRDLILR